MSDLRQQFLALEQELCSLSLEREEVVRGLLLALLSRSHAFLLGPPGADKSRLVSLLMEQIQGTRCFTLLLTRFTAPEEVMGPLSLKALEQGVYSRVTKGALPEAELAFLDEIFKANSSILNALLQIANERTYRNAGQVRQAPLICLFAASNELPREDELGPLYDRLLLRYEVSYLVESSNLQRLLAQAGPFDHLKLRQQIVVSDLLKAQTEATRVQVTDEVLSLTLKIRSALLQEGLTVSDRRLKASLAVVKAQAWLAGRAETVSEDLEVLSHVFWSEPKHRRLVADRVLQLASPALAKALELRDLAAEQEAVALRDTTSEADSAEAMTKLKTIHEQLRAQVEDLNRKGGAPTKVERALLEVQAIRRRVLLECLGVEV